MKPEQIRLLPRYSELAKYRAYFEGKQYEGRPDFWTGLHKGKNEVVPVRERAPCIIYPMPKACCSQVVRFTFGEGKFPALKVKEQKDDAYQGRSLSTEEAKTLEDGLRDLVENARLKPGMRAIMGRGLSEKTAVAIMSIKAGRFTFDIAHAQDCHATFKNDDPSDELLAVTWCYQYEKPTFDASGRMVPKKFWFRREITKEAYVDFEPVEVDVSKGEVQWGAAKETKHGWGVCPVLWIRNLTDTCDHGQMDGISLYEDLFEEFDALNLSLSQRHRGIVFFGTPQAYETGVQPGDGPEADGRKAVDINWSPVGGKPAPHGQVAAKARRMAPDRIWSYEGQAVTVGLIETTGKAFEVTTAHVQDVRERLLESMSVILTSAEQFVKGGGDMNAKFLVLAFAPLLNLVSELREATWWPNGLRAALSLMLRVLAKTGGAGVILPNAVKLAELAKRFEIEVESVVEGQPAETVWMLPEITPVWGQAFEPSSEEVQADVKTATDAKDGGLVQKKTAAQYVASHFGVTDVDAEIEAQRKEQLQQADEDGKLAVSHEILKADGIAEANAKHTPPPAAQPPTLPDGVPNKPPASSTPPTRK